MLCMSPNNIVSFITSQLATLNDLDQLVKVLLENNADPLARTEVSAGEVEREL